MLVHHYREESYPSVALAASGFRNAAGCRYDVQHMEEWLPSLTQASSLYSRYGKIPVAWGKVIRTSACTT